MKEYSANDVNYDLLEFKIRWKVTIFGGKWSSPSIFTSDANLGESKTLHSLKRYFLEAMESSTDFLSCEAQDNIGSTIRVLRPYIEQKVTFQHVAARMTCMRDIYGSILENRGDNKKVADMFFSHLEESSEPGKYQELLSALELKYPLVVKVIKNNEISTTDKENERLIQLFIVRLSESIDPELMSEVLFERQLIEGHEKDKIRNLNKHDCPLNAALFLLTKVHCRKPTWYEEFLEILWEMNHHGLVKDIDEKFYNKKIEPFSLDSIESSQSATSMDSPVPVLDQSGITHSLEMPSSSRWQDMSGPTGEDESAPGRKNIMEEVLNQLKNLSNQMNLQRREITDVSDRLLAIERKVDQILEKS